MIHKIFYIISLYEMLYDISFHYNSSTLILHIKTKLGHKFYIILKYTKFYNVELGTIIQSDFFLQMLNLKFLTIS